MKLNRDVQNAISQFEHPEQLLAAAEKAADRLNKIDNRLKLIGELKLIECIITGEPAEMVRAVAAGQQSITDSLRDLRDAVEQLNGTKQDMTEFLQVRLNGFMIPSEQPQPVSGLAIQAFRSSPLASELTTISNLVRSATADLEALQKDINERLLM